MFDRALPRRERNGQPSRLRARCSLIFELQAYHTELTDSSQSTQSIENLYLGELSPRSPRRAFWLAMLAPGLGWLYTGQLGGAIATNLALISFWGFFVVALTMLKFFPVVPTLVFAFGWSVIVLMNAADAANAARSRAERFVLRETNHPLIYVAVFVFSFLVPALGIIQLATHGLWERAVVQGDAMYPSLIAGDHLVVDRSAYRNIAPSRGDVIIFTSPDDSDQLLISRIIGVPGDEVAIRHDAFTNEMGVVRVGEDVIVRAPMSADMRLRLEHRTGPIAANTTLFVEDNGTLLYPITLASTPGWTQPATLSLGEGEYVVINDNRGDLHDSRTFGVIDENTIRGMPLFVGVSGTGSWPALLLAQATGSAEPYRRERFGRRIQLPNYLRPDPVVAE